MIKNIIRQKQKTFLYYPLLLQPLHLSRSFSSSPSLKVDDIITRLNKLIETNKKLVNESILDTNSKEKYQKLIELHEELHEKTIVKEFSLKINISVGSACLNGEEQEKVKTNNNILSPIQKAIADKLNKLDENDDNYLLELLKLQTIYNKSVINKLETTQSIVYSAAEREHAEGNFSNRDMSTFYGFYINYNKEKEISKKEESKILSLLKDMESKPKEESKILSMLKDESESSTKSSGSSKDKSKESTVDFVVQKMDEDMPSYMDPED